MNYLGQLIIVFSLLAGCSLKKASVGMAAGIFEDAAYEIETETDWEHFKNSLPAMIKILESFYFIDPANKNILAVLMKAHAAYSFAVIETNLLEAKMCHFGSAKINELKERASAGHGKAIFYGNLFLKENGLDLTKLNKAKRKGNLSALLKRELGVEKKELDFLFYYGQAFATLVNLQKNNSLLVAQMPIIKGIYDYICEVNPNLHYGACNLFYASYENSRPKMYGGNPEKAKEIFLSSIEKYENNIFNHYFYLEQYLLPLEKKEEIKREMSAIKDKIEKWERTISIESVLTEKYPRFNESNFFNTLARKRYSLLNKCL